MPVPVLNVDSVPSTFVRQAALAATANVLAARAVATTPAMIFLNFIGKILL